MKQSMHACIQPTRGYGETSIAAAAAWPRVEPDDLHPRFLGRIQLLSDIHLTHRSDMSFPSPSSGSGSRRRFQPVDTLISSLKIVERETPSERPPAPNDPVRPTPPAPPAQSQAAGPSAPRSPQSAESSTTALRAQPAQHNAYTSHTPVPRPPPAAPASRRAYGQSLVSAPASFTSTLVAASRSLGPINQDVPDDEDHRAGNSFIKEWGYEDDEMRRLFEEARKAMELEVEQARMSAEEGGHQGENVRASGSETTRISGSKRDGTGPTEKDERSLSEQSRDESSALAEDRMTTTGQRPKS